MQPQRGGLGAGLLVLSMAGFALSDALAKQVAGRFGAFELAWLRYLALLATALPWAVLRPAHAKSGRPGLQCARAVALVGSAVLFLYGLRALPVAEATAMVFASPLFVTLLAALVLREGVAPARWMPVLLGFAGVLVVARPGAAGFGGAAFFPLASSAAWACAVILTRRLASIDSVPTTMLYSAVFGSLGLSVLALPSLDLRAAWEQAPLLAAMAGAWCAAQWLVIAAYRLANPSRIAPFAYSQLVWAASVGFVVFGHLPDGFSLAGMGIILASGLLAAWQSRTRA